jgi:hypothetical protein
VTYWAGAATTAGLETTGGAQDRATGAAAIGATYVLRGVIGLETILGVRTVVGAPVRMAIDMPQDAWCRHSTVCQDQGVQSQKDSS